MQDLPIPAKGSAERILLILATLAHLGRSATMAELTRLTGIAQSSLYRQLALLRRWGFVVARENEFSPGPLCVPLAHGFDHSSFLTAEAHGPMEELAMNTGESVGLMVAVRRQIICLDMVESHQPLRCSFVKGRMLPLYRGATAKGLFAFMHEQQRRAALEGLQAQQHLDATAMAEFRQQLASVRSAGYAVSNGEVDAGIWGISAPLYPNQNATDAIAVITLMAPSLRAQGQENRLIEKTVRSAAHISARLQSL